MRTRRFIAMLLLMVPVFGQGQAQSCLTYNTNNAYGYVMVLENGTGHTTANQHGLWVGYYGSCYYSAVSNNQTVCSTSCKEDSRTHSSKWETGSNLYNPLSWHSVGWDGNTGSGYNPEGSASCGATAAVAVTSCSIAFFTCPSSVGISGSGAGAGVSITWPNSPIWKTTDSHTLWCPSKNAPTIGTPIIIDTDAKGFHLSSSLEGVPFDFFGTGLIKTAWPLSTNGFLVLPDANGMVPTGKQMFGNQTGYANGFDQLAQYDDNHDGEIDSQDPIYDQLYVWIDANRDGISQPHELQPLRNIVASISLRYKVFKYVDDNGNAFRYRSTLKLADGNRAERVVDVILSFGAPVN